MSDTKYKEADLIIDYETISYRQQTQEFLHKLPNYTLDYFISLFPIATWIHRYNLQWLIRDIIAGVTVGIVVVPQSMGYAKIAQLPPQYGLYTAFVGLCVYCLFATSKDISIGPTAVMSLLVGQTITRITTANSDITGPEIAVVFSILTGAIAMFIGLVRLGIIIDFIPAPAIAGFMTGSAITISIGQWPKLFGIKSINTQNSTYLIFGNFFKHLPETKLDVAFGLSGLVWLYGVRFACQYLSKRYPKRSTLFFFISIMRNGILIIFGTLVAFLINIGKSTSPISILKTVPPGFQAMGVPQMNTNLISAVASSLPSGVIILILEHIAIAKSFGRINDYNINPNQEIIAIGFTNIWAAFFGAYPSTGSFSRSAIKARSGVKTPLAGIFSACVVILALYALTPAFYYIPDASLAAVVIHAVSDLVSGPSYVKRLAKISLWECFTFVVAIIITFFTTVEYGIYASVGLSIVILLVRVARPRFTTLGRIPLAGNGTYADSNDKKEKEEYSTEDNQNYLYVSHKHPSLSEKVSDLPAGILMCRVDESFTYPNSSYISEKIIAYGKSHSRRYKMSTSKGDRAWNDDSNPERDAIRSRLPLLHAMIIDFASVNRLDSSGLQGIMDAQVALTKYSGRHVEFHFVNIIHPGIRNALIVAGFSNQPRYGDDQDVSSSGIQNNEVLPVVPPSKDGPIQQYTRPTEISEQITDVHYDVKKDDESIITARSIPLPRDRYPFFHWSADEAVKTAVHTLLYRPLPEESSTPELSSTIENSSISPSEH